MFKMVAAGSFVAILSLLVGCGDEASSEELAESGEAIAALPSLPTSMVPVPPSGLLPPLPVVVTLETNVRPTSIALDSSNVYYTDTFELTSEVVARPLAGGAKTVLHSTFTLPSSLVRFGSTVYWVDFTNAAFSDGGVWSAPTSGASPAVRLVSHTNPVTAHQSLAVFSTGAGFTYQTHVLYADAWASKLYAIRRWFFSTSESSLVPDAFPNYYPFAVAIDSSHVYFTHDAGHGLWRVPLAGGTPTLLVSGEEQPGALVVTGGQIYFVNEGDIKTEPAAGGAASTFAESVGTIQNMVAANGYLYWSCSSCNTIRKKPLAGGSSTLLVSGQTNLKSLAVDATHVYFGTNTALKRAPN
ncbi:MAG: hypothetical protein EOO73_25755 [Myxococcales bacterium]|nr:MAG: hypothetical protein EOO73_25755 [Myxococcales bacterium]